MREAVAAENAGMKVEKKPKEFPAPEELKEKFRNDPRFKRAFEALATQAELTLTIDLGDEGDGRGTSAIAAGQSGSTTLR